MPPNGAKHTALSFKYAFSGVRKALREEPKLRIHFVAGVLVILAGFFFNISKEDWIIIIILTGLVISVELTNTAIEVVVNQFTSQEHPGAELAKDISAGAVLVVAITSALVGLVIFAPHYLWAVIILRKCGKIL